MARQSFALDYKVFGGKPEAFRKAGGKAATMKRELP
jgi:hypothetical protein